MKSKKEANNLEEKVSDEEVSNYEIATELCKEVGRGAYKAGAATCKGVYKAGKRCAISAFGTPEEVAKHVPFGFSLTATVIEILAGGIGAGLAATSGAWVITATGGYAVLDGIARFISSFCHNDPDKLAGLVGLTRTGTYHAGKGLARAPGKMVEHCKRKIISERILRRNRQFDHVELYKTNTKLFRRYFNDLCDERKKEVLKDIIPVYDTNTELKEYLERKYADLIQKVGRDRITK